MRQNQDHFYSSLFEIIADVDPCEIIHVLEKGLDIEQLIQSDENERRIRHCRALLCFLRLLRLGS